MFVLDSLEVQIEELLDRIARALQLTDSQKKLAVSRYGAVSEWLAAKESVLAKHSPDIYPQGSLRIGTTVRPVAQLEFDLDLVCEFQLNPDLVSPPTLLLDAVEARLRQHEKYGQMLTRKNRCLRLNYANDFHMDILPAAPANSGKVGCIVVPDSSAGVWKASNPRGFADWFESKAKLSSNLILAEIEQLPSDEPFEIKPPLKRAVQLWKRWRDIYYEDKGDVAPVSIVLTTIAAHAYSGQNTVLETLISVISATSAAIATTSPRIVVCNPTNPEEDLSERWDKKQNYDAFVEGVEFFKHALDELRDPKGTEEAIKLLGRLFGEKVSNTAFQDQAKAVQHFREREVLAITKGVGQITTAAAPSVVRIPANTFYGE